MKNTEDSEFNSKNHKKISGKLDKGLEQSSQEKQNDNNENDDSAGELNKDDSPNQNED